MKHFFKLLRPHHWIKNTLILLPPIAGGYLQSAEQYLLIAFSILLFSLTSSIGYIINDLKDVKNDQLHFRKKNRPIAAGHISSKQAKLYILTMCSCVAILSILLNWHFAILLLVYLTSSVCYTYIFKKVQYVDILVLSLLYTLRVFAGIIITPAYGTFWLYAFTIFLFLSLASLKRFTEVRDSVNQGAKSLPGRGYLARDGGFLQIIGIVTGVIAIATLYFYTLSSSVISMYQTPEVLIALPIILAVWLNIAWKRAQRGLMHSDPIVYALLDKSSYIAFVLGVATIAYARA